MKTKSNKIVSALLAVSLLTVCFSACGGEKAQAATLVYTVTDSSVNGAGGTLGITLNEEIENLWSYNVRWGDENGVFENYTSLGSVGAGAVGETVTFSVPSAAIPAEASYICVQACDRSGETLSVSKTAIPEEAKTVSEKLYEFQVFSDYQTISTSETDPYNVNAVAAFTDVKNISPDTTMIINNGDVVEYAQAKLYSQFFANAKAAYGSLDALPQMYFSIGNHEFTNMLYGVDDYESSVQLWNEYTASYNGTSDVYFYKIINGSYFIFLGSVTPPVQRSIGYVDATLGDEQLDWLETVLEEAAGTGNPIYTFLHQPLQDTVSGSLTELYQEWYGVTQNDENDRLQALLDQYPQLLHFSSHTHWHLQSEGAWKYGNGEAANYFNTASVGYLWQGDGGGYNYAGAEGLYVEVYKDYVLVRGRSFDAENPSESQWISTAQFIVPAATALP